MLGLPGRSSARCRKAPSKRLAACTDRLLNLYERLSGGFVDRGPADWDPWERLLRRLEIGWNLLVEKATPCELPSSIRKRQWLN